MYVIHGGLAHGGFLDKTMPMMYNLMQRFGAHVAVWSSVTDGQKLLSVN